MRESRDLTLWGFEPPAWTEESPRNLLRLFKLHQEGSPTESERNDYSILLMRVVGILFSNRRFHITLPEVRLDPSDVAQDCLCFLTRKTVNCQLRLDVDVRKESERPLVLLKLLYTAISRFVFSAVTEARRRNGEVSATDYYVAEDSGGLDACSRLGDAAGAVAVIRDVEEAEDYCIGGIVTRSADETDAVNLIWVCLCEKFCTSGHLLSYDEMPDSVRSRKEVSCELHARILARFNLYLRETCSAA